MNKIKELTVGMSKVDVKGKIVETGDERQVMTKYGRKRVSDAILEDETGKIKISLWEEQIDTVKKGDTIEISGAYVSEFRDEMQLNIPRSGSLKVVE